MTKHIDSYPIPVICPYCNSPVIFTSNEEIYGRKYGNGMCYKCIKCDSYVGVHTGTKIPLGRLADKELRELKKECHSLFDSVWQKNKNITREMTYKILAELLEIPVNECHFGWFDKETLYKAKKIMSKKHWEDRGNERKVNCWCIANADGICKVKECIGEIRQLKIGRTSPDNAARMYEVMKKSFDDYFSDDYEDTDTEE